MADVHQKSKRAFGQKGVKPNGASAVHTNRKPMVKTEGRDSQRESEAQVQGGAASGISTDCFNDLLSNFTKALTSSNTQSTGSASTQEQMLCEMGKVFFSSMMAFNQILQTHAASVASDSTPKNTMNGTNTIKEGHTLQKVRISKGERKSADDAVKQNASTRKPPRNVNDKAVNGATPDFSKETKDTPSAVADVATNSPHPQKNCKKHDGVVRNACPNEKGISGLVRNSASAPKTKSGMNKKITSTSGDASKQMGPRAPRRNARSHAAGSKSSGSKSTTVDVPAVREGNKLQADPKEDFNNAPTPNNIVKTDDVVYIDDLVSPEKQLNFNIYRFVDSCTAANLATAERKEVEGSAKSEEWPSIHADTTLTATPVSEVATSRVCPVIQNASEVLRAAFMGDVELLKAQDFMDLSYVDDVGRSALHYASAAGSAACVEYLLSCNVDVNLADRKGWTAIHIAVSKNFTDVARLLVKGGADIFAKLKHKCAPARLTDVYSPTIHFAAIKGNIEVTKLLIEHGASVNDVDSANMTPLYYAAFRPNKDYVKFLLDNGATINLKDVNGRTPFHCAALSGMVDNAKLMVEKHDFINDEDAWALTPYKLAELRNHNEFLTYLKDILHIVDEEVEDINRVISSTIAVALQEPNADQLYRCVTRIGADLCKTVFDLTMQIERNGGVLTADGTRRRTSGGIFFTCLRELYLNDIISKEDYNYIRAAENEKRIAKANERRNKLRARA